MLTPKSPEELKKLPSEPSTLGSGHLLLDELLDGGLRWGELSEWGMPWGQCLRDIILWFLVHAQRHHEGPCWMLWVYGHAHVKINPLAWRARGVDLSWLRFAYAAHPVRDLKPLFLSDFFRIIVIDGAQDLSVEDCAFLARQARHQKQMIVLLRSNPLSQGRGNVWAKTRINCWQDLKQQRIFAKILKGRHPRQIMWPIAHL